LSEAYFGNAPHQFTGKLNSVDVKYVNALVSDLTGRGRAGPLATSRK
jgi:hypothetical protein